MTRSDLVEELAARFQHLFKPPPVGFRATGGGYLPSIKR